MSEYLVLRDVLILSSILISDSCLSDLSNPKCVVERVVHRFLPSNFQLFSMLFSLPKRAAILSVYLLLGALPIEAELHKRQLSFLYILLSAENVKFKRIIERQLWVNSFVNVISMEDCTWIILQLCGRKNCPCCQNFHRVGVHRYYIYKRIYQISYNGKRWLWHQFHLIGMNYCWIKHILLCHHWNISQKTTTWHFLLITVYIRMRVDVCVIQLQWVKHQEVGRLKEWQLVSVTTEIVSMYLPSFSISLNNIFIIYIQRKPT
jgi:hypothetical protein